MRKARSAIILFVLCFGLLVAGVFAALPVVKVPVIVRFAGKSDAGLIRAFSGDVKYEYGLVSSVACSLPEQAIEALSRSPAVESVELDNVVYAVAQTLDWGVDRVDAELVHPFVTGEGVKVAIIDSGIDFIALFGNQSSSRNFNEHICSGKMPRYCLNLLNK